MTVTVKKISVSIVIPVYSGEKYLGDLIREIELLKNKWQAENFPLDLIEAIFVDDNAIDQSLAVLKQCEQRYAWVRVLSLSRNFGQHPATIAGTLYTSGDWVVTLDEDLQHRPIFIEDLLAEAIRKRMDIVYAKPVNGAHQSSYRDFSSVLFKRLVSLLTPTPFVSFFSSFRLGIGIE